MNTPPSKIWVLNPVPNPSIHSDPIKEELIDKIEPKDDSDETPSKELTSLTIAEPLVSHKINEELMIQLQKRQQDLLDLAEMLEVFWNIKLGMFCELWDL